MSEQDADELCPEATKPSTEQAFRKQVASAEEKHCACMRARASGSAGAGAFLSKPVPRAHGRSGRNHCGLLALTHNWVANPLFYTAAPRGL
jgi:hypothetical protein